MRTRDDTGRRSTSPAILILGASVVSGGTGYVVQLVLGQQLGPVGYAPFAVFWSALYLVVGAFGGVQQEVTRATSAPPAAFAARRPRLAVFALATAAVLFVLLAATGPLWSNVVFRGATGRLAWPLICGAAAYVLVAALCGALYGVRRWYPLVLLIVLDGVLRLAGVLLVLSAGGGIVPLAWAVAAPFPLAIAVVLPLVAARLRPTLDVGYPALTRNVARTIVAGAATACLISGFPALLAATSPGVPAAVLGSLTFALVLTRAPIVIPLLSLQSYLIVRFGDSPAGLLRAVLRIEAAVVAGAVVLAALAALLGPVILSWIREDYAVSSGMFFVVVASSGLIAALCVSGPATLARSAHGAYTSGWVVAAAVTLGALLLPLDFEPRVAVALLSGPAVGCGIHLLALRTAPPTAPPPDRRVRR